MSQDEQTSDAAGLEAASDGASPAIETAILVNTEKMRDRQLEMLDTAQAHTNSAFDFARELFLAKTPSQVMDLCSIRAQRQLAGMPPEEIEMPDFEGETVSPRAYIEAHPKGRELDPITEFSIEDDASHVLATFDTQMEAIVWAKEAGYEALVTRVRDLSDKNNPGHWRSF